MSVAASSISNSATWPLWPAVMVGLFYIAVGLLLVAFPRERDAARWRT